MHLRTPSRFHLLFVVAIASTALRTFADEAGRYQGKDWALLDAKQVMRAADGITLAQHPNCDAVIVDERTIEAYQTEGTAECQDETFTKVLTEKGKRDHDVLSLDFLLPYFTVQAARLEVIKPDGTVVPVDVAANSRESIDNSQMQENIYDPNSRILRVNIPGLEIGDVVHAVTRTTIRRAIIPREFADSFLFEGPDYIRHVSCELRAPAAEPLKHFALRDQVNGTVTYATRPGSEGTVVYDWEINGVPRMYDEPAMPPHEMVLQRLLVSTLSDWRAVSRWYWQLSQPHLDAASPEMRATVDQLTAGAATDQGKINAIFHYVSQNIRYMGVTPEKDRPGFEPHDVQLTFAKKYGVCRDKAALLVALLRMAGQKAYPVLINVGSKLDQEIPNPDFNHAIVAVESSQGAYLLMDPTDEHTRVLLPAYDDNQSYLVCRPEGEDLRTSPVTPPDENMMQISTAANLAADGSLTATTEMSFDGVNDDAYRGAFAEMKPDDRRRFFESRLQRCIPGARLTSLQISPENVLDESVPLHARMEFSAAAMAAFGSDQAVVTVPWIGRDFGVVNFILDGTGLAKRKYPMDTEVTCGISEEVTLKLAGDFTRASSIPSASDVDDDCVDYHRHFGFADRTLHCAKQLKLKVVEFSPAQYLELKRTLADVDYDERKAPVMMTVAPPAGMGATAPALTAELPVESNAKILEDEQQLTVKDAHTAVLRVRYVKRILSYAGKIRESEIKVPYNPSTGEVRLLHAVVTSPSGQRQEVSKDEINVMDAEWNGSAARYTGGKIFVDSLPGVEIGSTIDVEFEIVIHARPYLSGFESFQLPDELEQKAFRITAPAGLTIQTRDGNAAGIVTGEKQTVGGSTVLEWQAHQVAALPEEPGLPPDWSYQAGVDYYVGDLATYLKELNSVMLERAGKGAKAGALARQLAGRAKTKLDAVRAIRDYIAENVRLAGPSFTELPLSELSDADATLAAGYGHLADRAILFQAMLAAAGFRPEFVLASDLPPLTSLSAIARSFPRPDAFQTPLVRVVVDGETDYLNDTDQYARLGSTPHDDRLGIVLGSGTYETIRASNGCHARVVTVYSLSLADDGNARIGIKQEYYGMTFAGQNRHFSELRPEERARYFQDAVSRVAQGARPVGGLTTDFGHYPGVEQFTVEVDRYGIADGRFLYFNLPFTPRLLPTGTNRRALPLFISSDSENTIRAEITLPAKYQHVAIAPREAGLDGPDHAGSVRIVSTNGRGSYVITYQLDLRPAIIRPADYPAALAVESALENKAARVLLLDNTSPPSQPGP